MLLFWCSFASFLVQFLLLPGTVSAAVLGQFFAAILVQFLVHFWCSFGHFPAHILRSSRGSFLLHSSAVFAAFFFAVFTAFRY